MDEDDADYMQGSEDEVNALSMRLYAVTNIQLGLWL
jgi:hypothetical protein